MAFPPMTDRALMKPVVVWLYRWISRAPIDTSEVVTPGDRPRAGDEDVHVGEGAVARCAGPQPVKGDLVGREAEDLLVGLRPVEGPVRPHDVSVRRCAQ